ncbi:MAG: hypothetical protein AAF216_01155 [Pseudomonadota bacterium]
MTANGNAAPGAALYETIIANLRAALAFVAKIAIAGLLVVAAGLLAMVTAVFGLVIAGIAVLLRFTGWGRAGMATRRTADRQDGDTITLEAHRTAHGWTVER